MRSSPFPGMDPYLESRWSDVHSTMITLIKEAIQPLLPPELRARAEERVWLEAEESPMLRRRYKADVALVEQRPLASDQDAIGSVATIEPVIVEVQGSPEVDRHVQIVDISSNNRVVTAIELLSPGNKRSGAFNRRYRRKLRDYIRAGVNVVEIDLLLGSRKRLPVSHYDLPPQRRATYLVCINRETCPDQWEAYPIPLRERLPRVPVPLREGEQDVPLELQPLIDRAYESGRHDDIDYSKPADPPLEIDDAAWADDLLRKAGLRN
jgi:hypothetical protein